MVSTQFVWSLDSCDCKILLSYENTTDTWTPVNFIRTCQFHISFSDIIQRHSIINEENTRKNIAYQFILDHAPASMLRTRPNGTVTLAKGVSIDFAVAGTAPNRTFTITVSGATLTQNQINTAQNFVDNRFGVGKVTIVNTP